MLILILIDVQYLQNADFSLEKGSLKKKNFMAPYLWIGFNYLKARATSRRQFTFYH